MNTMQLRKGESRSEWRLREKRFISNLFDVHEAKEIPSLTEAPEVHTVNLDLMQRRLAAFVEPLFAFGIVSRIHVLGRYAVVEYLASDLLPDSEVRGKIRFQPYRNGHCLESDFPSLEEAIIFAISDQFNPPARAGHMAEAACAVLRLKT